MKKTVVKVIHNGTYRVEYDDSKHLNPYTIYHEYYGDGGRKHKTKVEAYADLTSCLYHLSQTFRG